MSAETNMRGLVAVAILIFVLSIIAVIVPSTGDDIGATNAVPDEAYATGTLTFTGNAADAENVTITIDETGYIFEINSTGTITSGNIGVDVATLDNATVAAALDAAIDANTSTSAVLTATSTVDTVVLTADVAGTTANGYGTTEAVTNATWGSSTMTGGVDGSDWNANYNTDLTTGADIWSDNISTISSAAGIVIVAVIIGVIMGLSSKKKD